MNRSLTVVALSCALVAPATALAAKGAKKTTGTAWVGVTHQEGSDLYVAGDFKDKVLGRGTIVYVVAASPTDEPTTVQLTAKKVTLSTEKGSFVGKGSGLQVVAADGSVSVQDGKVDLTRGTGAYKGKTFKGTFSGPLTDGVYTFTYDAKITTKKKK